MSYRDTAPEAFHAKHRSLLRSRAKTVRASCRLLPHAPRPAFDPDAFDHSREQLGVADPATTRISRKGWQEFVRTFVPNIIAIGHRGN
ncbi:hypothetical protein ACVBGC_31635 [Burkholderia stagnalis]